MRKRLTILLAGVMSIAMMLTGCQASQGLETEEIKIAKYRGVEVDKVDKPAEVTDEDVESNIQETLESKAETKEIKDRAVQDGDIANIDFVGKIDGKAFDGGSSEGFDLEIGSDSFIDGFEDSIIGHKIGDKFDWEGKFPDNYGNTEYAGKDVVFTITVNSITEKKVPELTDKLVAELSETAKTVKEYKAEVKQQLTDNNETEYNNKLYSAVWQEVLKNTEVKKYPDGEKEKFVQTLTDNYKKMAETYNMEFADFLEQMMGMTEDDFNKQVEAAAEQNVMSKMATEAIAEKENIKLDDDTYEAELQKIVDQYGYESVDVLKEQVDKDTLKDTVLNNIVVERVAKNCVQKASE